MKKYQNGGDKAAFDKIKTATPQMKTGVYKIDKTDPRKEAYKKDPIEIWARKERQKTNPNNKPAGSPIRQLKKGGNIKKKK